MGGLQHYLLLAIETVIDLGSHVISSEGYPPPTSYSDVFKTLAEEGVLPPDLADRLMAMARFRNVLVHLYAEVDEERVLQILRGPLSDLDEFVTSLQERFAQNLRG